MLPTIIFCIALFLSIVLAMRLVNSFMYNHFYDEMQEDEFWWVEPVFIFVVCVLWSWLFWLLH